MIRLKANRFSITVDYFALTILFESGAECRGMTSGFFHKMWDMRIADAALQAVADFYAGPEYFDSTDPEKYHMELRRFNYAQVTPDEARVDVSTVHKKIRKHSHAYLVLSVLCWFLPSRNVTRVVDLYDIGLPFTARRLFHFDAESGKGILVERNRKEARRLWREYRSICRTIDSRHDEVTKLWREHKKVMVTKEYWEKYLGI